MNAILKELECVSLNIKVSEISNNIEIDTENYLIVADVEIKATEHHPAEPSVGIMFSETIATDLVVKITEILDQNGEELTGDFSEIEKYLEKYLELEIKEIA